MRIYHGDYTVRKILDDCRQSLPTVPGTSRIVEGIDLDRLNQRISEIPVQEIRLRRKRLTTFHEECLVSADPDRGISFTSILLILAHYKVINDNKSLRYVRYVG